MTTEAIESSMFTGPYFLPELIGVLSLIVIIGFMTVRTTHAHSAIPRP